MKHLVLWAGLAASIVVLLALPPVPQPLGYHRMADERTLLGVPNAFNVLSNLPFALVGALGLAAVLSRRAEAMFVDRWERWPYTALFAGMALTALGSSYYHLAPDNARLVWDRLPMTLGFTGFLAAVITERIGVRAGRRLLIPLLLAGVWSVVYWNWTELRGAGDLRPYGIVQFGSLLIAVLLLAFHRGTYPNTGYLFASLAAYAAAKAFELADYEIFSAGNFVSGHTLKHLTAAVGAAIVIAMLRDRAGRSASPSAGSVIGAISAR